VVGGFKFEPNSSQRSNTGPGATGERHRGARRALNTQPAASKPNSRRKGHLATCVKRSPLRLREGSLRYGWLIAPLHLSGVAVSGSPKDLGVNDQTVRNSGDGAVEADS
jgi:hypothetical protein